MKQAATASMPRILIVDDHGISRQFMAEVLQQNAIPVRQARDAHEARRIASVWLPQVILLDVRLADENGYATAAQIRRDWPPGCPWPRIVMLSADPQERMPETTAVTADAFLLKPVSARELMRAVLVESRQAPFVPAAHGPAPDELQGLFRAELTAKLQSLDQCLCRPDLAAARGILHQLIASSALCRQRRLEHDLRALYAACGMPANAPLLAGGYFSLLSSTRDYLGQP